MLLLRHAATIAAVAAASLAGAIVLGCARTAPASGGGVATTGRPLAAGGELHELVSAKHPESAPDAGPLRFEGSPDVARIAAGGERRDAVIVGTGRWSWRLRVPPAARLRGAVQLVPGSAGGGGVQTTVSVAADGSEEVLEVIRLPDDGTAEAGWLGLDVDLGAWSGREVVLGFDSASWGDDDDDGSRLAWAPLRIVSAPEHAGTSGGSGISGDPPSILLIVADTLRRDRVSAYADARATTPEIRRLLAARGLVFERAYAQAPWTAPSVASYAVPGEAGTLGARDFAAALPLLLLAAGRPPPGPLLSFGGAAAAVWTLPALAAVLATGAPPDPVAGGPLAALRPLPVELTRFADGERFGWTTIDRGAELWVVPTRLIAAGGAPDRLWLRGDARAEIWVAAPQPLDAIDFTARARSPHAVLEVRSGGRRLRARFDTADKRAGTPLDVAAAPRAAGLRVFGRREVFHRLGVTTGPGLPDGSARDGAASYPAVLLDLDPEYRVAPRAVHEARRDSAGSG